MKKFTYLFKHKYYVNYFYCLLTLICGFILFQSCERKQGKFRKNNNDKEIKRLVEKGDSLYDFKSDSATIYLNKAISLFDPETDKPESYVRALSLLANLQQNVGDYYLSEETLAKTLPYLKKIKDPKYASNVYSITSYNYYYNYDYTNAYLYQEKALKITKKPFKLSMIKTSLALLKMEQNKYKEAAEILIPLAAKKVKHEADQRLTDSQYSIILNNLGVCYWHLNNPKALKYLKKSIAINLKLKDEYALMQNYFSTSLFYKKNNSQLAILYALKSYKSAEKANNAYSKANALTILIKFSQGNDLKKYSSNYVKIIDSIMRDKKIAKNQSLYIKSNFENDKTENTLLKNQKIENELLLERHRTRIIISYIIIVSILLLLTFSVIYLKVKNRKEKNEIINKSEKRIYQKLDNELAADIYNTVLFAKNTDLEEDKEHLLKNLEGIYSKTRNISRENSLITTDENYIFELEEMIARFKTQKTNIFIHGLETIVWNKINKNKKILVYRVIQELFSNMRKNSEATLASIIFKVSNKEFVITYIDNGNGIEHKNIIFRNGLQNMENRVNTIKGKIEIKSNKNESFKVFIKFPISC